MNQMVNNNNNNKNNSNKNNIKSNCVVFGLWPQTKKKGIWGSGVPFIPKSLDNLVLENLVRLGLKRLYRFLELFDLFYSDLVISNWYCHQNKSENSHSNQITVGLM